MTDERIREALTAEAADAPAAGDLWERTNRRIRRRRLRRQAVVAAVVLLAAVGIGTVTLPGLDEPREVVLGEADVPPDWQDVSVANALVSVPGDWEIVDVTLATADAAGADGDPACPDFDPDRPVLAYSAHGPPLPCPEDPGSFSGLAVAALDAPPPTLSPTALEDGEPTRAGTVPARAVPAAMVTGAGDVTTFVAPGVQVAVEVHPGEHADEVEAALDTLRPYEDEFDGEGVVHAVGLTDADVAPPAERELVGWAIDADGRFHRWFSAPVGDEPTGAAFWPATTGSRFGAIVETGDRVRVAAARPGDDAPAEFPLGADASLETVAWSPGGEAVAWLVTDPEPRLELLAWEDADALADGAEPTRTETPVTGLPDATRLSLAWEIDDRGEHLAVHHGGDGPFRADAPRDDAGGLELPDPLEFTPQERVSPVRSLLDTPASTP